MERILRNDDETMALIVPIDHPAVVQCRPPNYLYAQVEKCLQNHEAATSEWLEACGPLVYAQEFEAIADERADDRTPYWNNGFFNGDDVRSLVAMLRHYAPRRYVEIGSGNSTKFARWAIDHWRLPTEIVCIDPAPRAHVAHIADRVIEKSLLEIDDEIFAGLGPGDILFHDGSHLVFNGTDTTKLFLEVLPLIKPGVVVHIHDIILPWEYLSAFDHRGYNEQYLLATLLLFGVGWEVIAPITYLHKTGRLRYGGTSFWMRKL